MLSKKRVILMTQMASYEEKEGRKNVKIANYFRRDYIAVRVLKAFISGVISYGILFGLYMVYHFNDFMENIYTMDLLDFGKKAAVYGIGFVVVYCILTYIAAFVRYMQAKKNTKLYYHSLKKLGALYGESSEEKKQGGGKK